MSDYNSKYKGPEMDSRWDQAHGHSNKTVLDSITQDHLDKSANAATTQYVDSAVVGLVSNDELAPIESAVSSVSSALATHVNEDGLRWSAEAKAITDLRAELKQFVIDTYAGTTPEYDYAQTQTILQAGGLVNLADQGTYTVPTNGAIQAQVGGLLGVGLTVQVNGETVWTSPLNLLVPLSSPEIQVSAGDKVSAVGTLGVGQTIVVNYFPNRGA